MNPVDEYGVEEALRLRDAHGGEVTVLTMGPEGAEKNAVRKALSLGADKGVLVKDDRLHGSDAMATAYTLALALAQMEFDLVILGSESTDARTSLVPQALAQLIGLPGLTYAKQIEIDGSTIRIHREEEGGYAVVEARLPAVVSVVKGINEPRYATLKGINVGQVQAGRHPRSGRDGPRPRRGGPGRLQDPGPGRRAPPTQAEGRARQGRGRRCREAGRLPPAAQVHLRRGGAVAELWTVLDHQAGELGARSLQMLTAARSLAPGRAVSGGGLRRKRLRQRP